MRDYRYNTLGTTYIEPFFVSYAVRGPILNPNDGSRAGMPLIGPVCGPVEEPSPLNTQYALDAAIRAQWDNRLPVFTKACSSIDNDPPLVS